MNTRLYLDKVWQRQFHPACQTVPQYPVKGLLDRAHRLQRCTRVPCRSARNARHSIDSTFVCLLG